MPVATSSAGTVYVSSFPSTFVAIPMYVVVVVAAPSADEGEADVVGTLTARSSSTLLDDVDFCAARPLTSARSSKEKLHFSSKGVKRVIGENGRPAVHCSRMQATESVSRAVWRA